MTDPVELTAALVRCPSVTPEEGGAIALLERTLAPLGFACTRIGRGGVENLHARRGRGGPVFAFAGHTDVVPPGDRAAWRFDPFGAEIADGFLWGRGAVDMKSGVAAFVAAVAGFVGEKPDASIVLLITGDEEGEATDGTVAILDWMRARGEVADFCLVGEPTSAARIGDVVKIGRRGSLNGTLAVHGRQGHAAYPERAANPLPALARVCAELAGTPLDEGSEHFQPSTLALTSIDTGNPAGNVVPAAARARFNIRFNDRHDSAGLKARVQAIVERELHGTDLRAELAWSVSGESFLTRPDARVEAVIGAIAEATGRRPQLTTGGGTSDARFIKDLCPVIEFGLVGETMHAVDERVPVAQVRALAEVYLAVLRRFFG
ncbi:MAG TPA: succinyl-diaminopimelate desuccinylase [Thermohalobaculum sp.]|nr:succinyl-diaminopimelate desuccinylase [Thermohalobaculum sp.]